MSYQPPLQQFEFCQYQPELAYFDSAASCQVPQSVLAKLLDYYQHQHANVHRASYARGRTATQCYEQARRDCAQAIGATAAQVSFQDSTTSALNGLAQQLPVAWQAGDEILLSSAEHHANILPWQRLAAQHDLRLRFISLDRASGELGEWQHLLGPRTKVVSLTLASNITGTRFALEPILAAAQQQGAWTIVDAAQAVAHEQLAVTQLGADAVVFSAHKAYGVAGCAVLWLSQALLAASEPFTVGGGIVTRVTKSHANVVTGIHKFEAGTPNVGAAVAAASGLAWLQQQQQLGLHDYLQALRQQLWQQLQQRAWLTLLPTGKQHTPVIAFYSDEFQAHDIATWLDQHQIAVRAGHHCAQILLQDWQLPAVVRVSLAAYNTPAQIERLVAALDAGWQLFAD